MTNSFFFHQIFGNPGAVYVRRREGEAFHPDCVVPTVKFGGGSVMVWGCMASSGTGMLYTYEGRMNSTIYTNILDLVYRSSLTKIFYNNILSDVFFQQDNAPSPTSKVSIVWFEKRDYSDDVAPSIPDLNPIETLWSHLGKRVRMHKCSSKKELETKHHEEWQKIDPTTCNNLVNNMQK